MTKISVILTLTSLILILFDNLSYSCDETVFCSSVVSKCLLDEKCKLNCKRNSTCSTEECSICLSSFYEDCCSFVGLCSKPSNASCQQSHVQQLGGGAPELFKALTENTMGDENWKTLTFPIDLYAEQFESRFDKDFNEILYQDLKEQAEAVNKDIIVTKNCTLAYLSKCLSFNLCKIKCQSMGAISYRWFHDGCCECVGPNCPIYGLNQSRCTDCREPIDDEYDEDILSDSNDVEYDF